MKQLHRNDLFAWSAFDEERNVDFNSVLWVRPDGNVIVDPMPLTEHDAKHLRDLGGVALVVITNSDHVRSAEKLRADFGAKVAGPAAERATFPIQCDRWVEDGEVVVPGLEAVALSGSKTNGELALILDETTLITGDLVRAHRAGSLMMLPDPKLQDKDAAVTSVRRLGQLTKIDVVLVGDGWHIFSGGHQALRAVLTRVTAK